MSSGATIEATSILFSIGTTTIKNWKRLGNKTGKVMGPGRPKNPYKIDADELRRFLEKSPDAYLHEIASHFAVTAPAIHSALKRMKITRKKSQCSTKSDAKIKVSTT